MEYTEITIKCPTTWFFQTQWIQTNCEDYIDRTNWALWQAGLGDIHILMSTEDAIAFKLLFGHTN